MSTIPRSDEVVKDILVFDVTGMDCGDCARSVERAVAQLPSVGAARVSFGAGTLSVTPASDGAAADDLVRAIGGAVDRAGYSAMLRTDARASAVGPAWWQSRKVIPTAIATLLWLVAFAIEHIGGVKAAAIPVYAVAIVTGGYPIARSALAAVRVRHIDMNVLMTISVIGAAILGDWSEGGLVVVLFSFGTFLQTMTLDRTRRAIRLLLDLAPEEAQVVRDGVEITVAASTLAVGDVVRVRPGGRLPVDGTILSGHTAVNQAAITGESMPIEKEPGSEVFAGTINGSGAIEVRVTTLASGTMLSRIVHLVEEAQASKAPSQQLVDRFSAVYTPVVVALAIALGVGGSLITGDVGDWTYRALVLLVIACPCALVISTPVSIVAAIQAATRMGVLVKGGAALEEIGRVDTMVFDKTGTVTVGRPAVEAISAHGDVTTRDLLALAAAVERDSEHPIARAIVAKALHDRVTVPPASAFRAMIGRGATATVLGEEILVGSARLVQELSLAEQARRRFLAETEVNGRHGRSTLAVVRVRDGVATLLGAIGVADRVRPGAAEAIAALRAQGIRHVEILTGDQQVVGQAIGERLAVDAVRAELLPDQKVAAVTALRAEKRTIAMVGDGINDAPALATADVGIAMGIGGTDAALESASLTLMRDDLGALANVVGLGQRMLTIIRQNVTVSLLTKVLALGLAMLGFVNLWIAVVVDVGTSLLVILNGLRLARIASGAVAASDLPAGVVAEAHAHDACGCDSCASDMPAVAAPQIARVPMLTLTPVTDAATCGCASCADEAAAERSCSCDSCASEQTTGEAHQHR